MKRLFWAGLVVLLFGSVSLALAEDVVYLKDGSIVHGSIIEEEPGVSIKIQTVDDNIFVYKMKQIKKITHSAAAPASDNDQATEAAPAAPPAEDGDETVVVVKKHKRMAPPALVNDFVSDPNGRFSVGSFYFGIGIMNPSVVNQFNNIETAVYGSSYDFTPLAYSGDLGIGWFTNHLALRWTGTYAFNWQNQTFSNYEADELLEVYGSELEADLSLDDVQTSKSHPGLFRVSSVYLPLMAGYWQTSLSVYDNYGNSDVLTGTETSFGTGLGLRFIDERHSMFDVQFLYRWSNSVTLKDPYGNYLVQPNGQKLNSSIAGAAFNISYGFTF